MTHSRSRQLGLLIALGLLWSAAAPAADSGGYRGPGRNGVFNEAGLMKSWPDEGPPLIWRYGNLGHGWSAPTVAGDTVYAAGGESAGSLYAFTLDGKMLYRVRYGPEFSVRYIGSRSTPAVSGEHIILCSGFATVYCMDAKTGQAKWSVDLVKKFGHKGSGWGYNITPLVTGNKVIVPIRRGTTTEVALDLRTGETIWTAEPSDYATGDSSPILVEHGKTRLVVDNQWHALIALDPDTGKIVWKREGAAGTSMTPVFSEGYLLADLGGKTVMFRPSDDGQGFDELWSVKRLSSISQAVIVDGKVFAFGNSEPPAKAAMSYLCLDAKTGKQLKAEPIKGKGPGSVVAADGMIYWQEDGPRITLARVTAEGFEIVSSFKPEIGKVENWIHPVIAGGRLFVRTDCAQGGDYAASGGKLAVYDLRAEHEAELREQLNKLRAAMKSLKSDRPADRAGAAEELRKMGFRARQAAPALVDALADGDETVRLKAAAAIVEIGPEAVPALIKSLRQGRADESLTTQTLVTATPGARDMPTALIDAAESSAESRDDVAILLRKTGPAAVPALDKLLGSDDKRLRWWAIRVVGEFGPDAKATVPSLIRLMNKDDQWFRALIARTLAKMGPEAKEAVPSLVALLGHSFPDARAAAAEALGSIGVKSEAVMAGLGAAAKDKDEKVAKAAGEAMGRLQGEAP